MHTRLGTSRVATRGGELSTGGNATFPGRVILRTLAFVSRDIDSAEIDLGARARRQSGVFTRADARAAGVPEAAIAHRLRSGLWITEYGGAIRAATTPVTTN